MFGPKTLWKLPTLQKLAKQAHFEVLHKKLKKTHVVFDKESKNGLCFEIGQRQQKCQRGPTLQSFANPAVVGLPNIQQPVD